MVFPELWILGMSDAAQIAVLLGGATVVIYLLARTRFYRVGIAALMATTFTYVVGMIIVAPNAHTAVLALVPVYMSSLFYDVRRILIIAGVSLLVVVVSAQHISGDWADVPLTLMFIGGSSVLALVSNVLLRHSERTLHERSLQLHDSESRFRAALDGALNIFYILRFTSPTEPPTVIEANRMAESHSGVPRSQVIGRRLQPRDVLESKFDQLLAHCRAALSSGITIAGECETPDERHYEYAVVPFENHVAFSLRDVTVRKQITQQALDLALERQRVTLLQQFIGDASHDMMSPLAVVKTSLYLIRTSDDQERRESQMAKMDTQLTRLQHMIRDMRALTDLDRLDTQELQITFVNVNEMLQELATTYDTIATLKDQKLRLDLCPESPFVAGERARLEVVISNLIENAFKYTPKGSTITVEVTRQGANVLIDVRDNGPGLKEDDLPYLFDRFYRSAEHRAADSVTAGSGLGLSIVKRVVEAHQGTVKASNLPTGGAQFRICLPVVTTHRVVPAKLPTQ
jgi:signal transduction histidine kinase